MSDKTLWALLIGFSVVAITRDPTVGLLCLVVGACIGALLFEIASSKGWTYYERKQPFGEDRDW